MGLTLLVARRTDATASYWAAILQRDRDELPAALARLVGGEDEAECGRGEALDVFHWARQQPEWQDEPMPFFMREAGPWEPSSN